jgi:hypothetical protein
VGRCIGRGAKDDGDIGEKGVGDRLSALHLI